MTSGCSFPQILGKVYSVLSDKDQRAVYDEQGTVDEDSDVLSQDRDWETYWRLLFKKVKNSGDFLVTVTIIHSTKIYWMPLRSCTLYCVRMRKFLFGFDILINTHRHTSGDTYLTY